MTATRALRATPFIKWAGGKNHLRSQLIPRIPLSFERYYEPFLGGGALFFALSNRSGNFSAFLSDTNAELINAFRVVKDSPKDLMNNLARLEKLYDSANERKACYYTIRKWKPTNNTEGAARFIFLNKTCYNGLYRVNKRGEFNVPFGNHRRPKFFDETRMLAASKALNKTNAKILALDYQKATADCGENDVVYLDPPYDPVSKTSAFTDYTAQGFSEEDQRELAIWSEKLADRGCIVVLSNSDTPFVRRLYAGFNRRSIPVARPISCNGARRKGFRELIVFKGVS